ncbi:hypothetical protein [Nocardia sp. NBC_00511]|uniref:hypothetical protein n=1 Tax=Nocardia sp. NBC_00511 TaxID=2903591 RepID=UPI0030E4A8E6
MNNIKNFAFTGNIAGASATGSVMSVLSASRGVLASQGIRLLSSTSGLDYRGDLGLQVFASKAQAVRQIVIKQDKPMGGWQPVVAYAATEAMSAVETSGIAPTHLPTLRPRNTDPATVIRSRHRSRLR